MSTSHYGINNNGISGSKPALQGWGMIRSILYWWHWRSTCWTRRYNTKGLLLMESISRLMDAALEAWWLHWLCPQASVCIWRPLSRSPLCLFTISCCQERTRGKLSVAESQHLILRKPSVAVCFPVNAMDTEDRTDRPQSMRAGWGVKLTVWSFQWTVWLASFPTVCLPLEGHIRVLQTGSAHPIS